MDSRPLKLGTRGSRLALAQATIVKEQISRISPHARVELILIRTAGDGADPGASSGADRKFAFTHELDRQLLDGDIDAAVHSLKDVPTAIDGRLTIAATPARGDPRDALVTTSGTVLAGLQPGSSLGTSSVRRVVQLKMLRTDIRVVDVRGNVETRIGKMKERGLEGVVLAAAGLQRLGLAGKASQYFEVDEMVPAACQGTLAVEARRDDRDVIGLLGRIDERLTHLESDCERAFLSRLGGDCDFPAGVYARAAGSQLKVVGMIADPDGASVKKGALSGGASGAERLGAELASRLLGAREGVR